MEFLENNGDASLAIVTLVLAFALKLLIDRSLCRSDFLSCLCDLPVDLIFTALAFFIAYSISTHSNVKSGLNLSLATIVISLIVIVLSRRSDRSFKNSQPGWGIIMMVLNAFIGITVLYYSIMVFTNPQNDVLKVSIENKIENRIKIESAGDTVKLKN